MDKINNHLSNEGMYNERIQSSPTKAKSMNDFETISHASLGSSAILKSHFGLGQSYMILDTYIDSIVRGPIIVIDNDNKGLEKHELQEL